MEKVKLVILLVFCIVFTGKADAGNILSYQTVSMNEKGEWHDILIEYPQVKVSEKNPDNIKAINRSILEWMEKAIMVKIPEIRVENILDYEDEFKGFLQNSYIVEFNINLFSENIVSIKFQRYWYYFGAAHGYSSVRTFNYDPAAGRVIQLKDIFIEGVNYLDQISEYVVKDLFDQYKKEGSDVQALNTVVKEGAAPRDENFDSFGLSKDSLIVYFDDYEVGSYSVGCRTVSIPYSELTGMSPEFMKKI